MAREGRRATSIACDDADLAVECATRADTLDAEIVPETVAHPVEALAEGTLDARFAAIAVGGPIAADLVIRAALAAEEADRRICFAFVPGALHGDVIGLARDLGIPSFGEIRPLLAATILVGHGVKRPHAVSTRGLGRLDRARLESALEPSERSQGKLVRLDGALVGWANDRGRSTSLGEARDVAEALEAFRVIPGELRPSMPAVDGVEPDRVTDVLFGPPRALSDPASKAALEHYDVPLPVEELCTSASRAAAEATRIGFPVRIALASPDLRVWEHPDLAVDHVDNAARVRDVFRQLLAVARSRNAEARLLGVLVSATSPAVASLRLRLEATRGNLVLAQIGFGDAHGLASADRVTTVLPASEAQLALALARLRGAPLLFGANGRDRKTILGALHDTLMRVAAFVHDWRNEVERVEIDPLAVLVGGGVEVREACVVVGESFARSLDRVAAPSHGP